MENLFRKLNKIFPALLIITTGIFLFFAMVIAIDGLRDNVHESDVAIVFGSKVNPNGTVLAYSLTHKFRY